MTVYCGDIGQDEEIIELEPVPEHAPVQEPVPALPVPVPEPVPA